MWSDISPCLAEIPHHHQLAVFDQTQVHLYNTTLAKQTSNIPILLYPIVLYTRTLRGSAEQASPPRNPFVGTCLD